MRIRSFLRGASPWLLLLSLTTEPAGALTLEEARSRALAASPELESGASEVRAREAHARQAGLPPNPELRTDLENVGGTGDRESFEETETTVRLSQRIELGGKRGKRRRVAELGQTLAGWDLEATKLAVVANATKAFVHALAAEARLRLAGDNQRHGDVFGGRELRQQMMKLKDEPERAAAEGGQRVGVQADDLAAVEGDAARRRTIEPAEQLQQRRLPDTGRADDGDRGAALELDVQIFDDRERAPGVAVGLLEILDADLHAPLFSYSYRRTSAGSSRLARRAG